MAREPSAAGTAGAPGRVPDRLPAVLLGAALAALAAAGAPPTLAHGPVPDVLFNPLLHEVEAWPTAEGALALDGPGDAAAAPLAQGGSGTTPSPATWLLAVPMEGTVLGGLASTLVLELTGPAVPRLSDNVLLEVATTHRGEVVEEDVAFVSAPETPMQPGTYTFEVRTGTAPFAVAAGDEVGLAVTFHGNVVNGEASLLLGPEGTRANLTVQAASLDALPHDHDGFLHMTLDDFASERDVPQERPVMDVDVRHGVAEQLRQTALAGTGILLRIDNAETPEQGQDHRPWGLEDPHVFRLHGLGIDETFRIYPSEVLLRGIDLREPGTLTLSCVERCAPEGPFATLEVRPSDGGASGNGTGDALTTTESVPLAPGQAYEANFPLTAQQRIRWAFTTSPEVPVQYDLHHHTADGDLRIHTEGQRPQANGTLSAPTDALYSLLLRNAGQDTTTVTYTLEGALQESGGVVKQEPERATPLPAGVAVAAALAATLLASPAARGGSRPPGQAQGRRRER